MVKMELSMSKWDVKGLLIGVLCVVAFAGRSADVHLIAVPDAATSVERTAARELSEALARMRGRSRPLTSGVNRIATDPKGNL